MVGKQPHNRQTNGIENEKSRPAISKPHENKENVYFTGKQKENIDTTYLKVLNTPDPPGPYTFIQNSKPQFTRWKMYDVALVLTGSTNS